MSHLSLESLTLHYGRQEVVKGLSLAVPQGQLVSLLGPSGCGKTSTLRAVAGLLAPSRGRIVLAGADITRVSAHQRDIGLVFQSYALFPHLSAFDNVAFGLRMRRVAEGELRQRVGAALDVVGLQGLEGRLPADLSGGQQQRVALARAIVLRPRLLLLDEPLSNLDAGLRVEMRAELRRIQRELSVTLLYVTHDQEEALSLSDRVVVMRDGRVEQDAPPQQVYQHPATAFVAGFMGWSNLFAWRDGGLVPPGRDQAAWPLLLPRTAAPVSHVAWRAEHLSVLAPGADPAALPGRVLARSYLGESAELLVATALGPVKARVALGAGWQEGQTVAIRLDPALAALI